MQHKILKLFSLAGIVFLLIGSIPALSKVNVFACEPEWKALAEEIGGDRVKAYSATTAFQDPHHIEAKPSLIAKARKADLLVCTGAELEIGWLPILLRLSGNNKIQVGKPGYLMASELVQKIEIPETVDRSQGDVHASGNPHIHLDPRRLVIIAKILTQRLVQIDPDHAKDYQQSFIAFNKRWKTAILRWEQGSSRLRNKQVVIHHRNLSYLLDWLGINPVADLEPKPGLPPNSSHLISLLKRIKRLEPDFVILAAYQSDKGAKWLSKRSGLPIVTLPYTVGGNPESKDLYTLFESTLGLLLEVSNG